MRRSGAICLSACLSVCLVSICICILIPIRTYTRTHPQTTVVLFPRPMCLLIPSCHGRRFKTWSKLRVCIANTPFLRPSHPYQHVRIGSCCSFLRMDEAGAPCRAAVCERFFVCHSLCGCMPTYIHTRIQHIYVFVCIRRCMYVHASIYQPKENLRRAGGLEGRVWTGFLSSSASFLASQPTRHAPWQGGLVHLPLSFMRERDGLCRVAAVGMICLI